MLKKLFGASLVIAAMVFAGCDNGSFSGGNGRADDDANPNDDTEWHGAGGPEDFIENLDDTGWYGAEALDELIDEVGDDQTFTDTGGNGRINVMTDEDDPRLVENKDATYMFYLPCDRDDFATQAETRFKGPPGSRIRVSGAFCPVGSDELNLLFVIDFSGSMGSGGSTRGNDEIVNGSCGRLRATKNVIQKALDELPENVRLKAEIIGFSDNASVRVPWGDAKDMLNNLNTGNVCGTDGRRAFTNYRAAFDLARQSLAGVDGTKVLYFISDGDPTAGGSGDPKSPDHERVGREAADRLKDQFDRDELNMNIVYIEYTASGSTSNNTRGYLDDIAGPDGKVRVVADADELVQAAEDFELPPLGVKKSSLEARLNYEVGGEGTVEIDTIKQSKKHGWMFFTKPFELKGVNGESSDNEVLVKARSLEGDKLEARINVRFLQEE